LAKPDQFKCCVKGCEEWLPFEEGVTCHCGQLYRKQELDKIARDQELHKKYFEGWTKEDVQHSIAPNFHHFRITGVITLLSIIGWAIFSYLASQPH